MTQIDYLTAFQTIAVVYVIIAVGYFCGWIKLFNSKDVNPVRRITYLVTIPGMYFEIIGNADASLKTWAPLFYTILTQLVIHFFIALVCFLPKWEHKLNRFVKYCYAATYPEYVFFAFPLIQTLYGQEYCYIPIISSIVTSVITNPIHNLLLQKSAFVGPELEPDEPVIEEIDDAQIEDPMLPEDNNTELKDTEEQKVDMKAENDLLVDPSEPTELQTDDGTTELILSPQMVFWKSVLYSYLNPQNICIVLGIIWSFLPWSMPKFLFGVVNDLEKTVIASGLFIAGVNMWEHPFFHCNAYELTAFVLVHVIAMPIITVFWALLFKEDSTTMRALIISNSSPSALIALISAINCGFNHACPTFTFFWTNLISIGVFLLWVTAFNEGNLFP